MPFSSVRHYVAVTQPEIGIGTTPPVVHDTVHADDHDRVVGKLRADYDRVLAALDHLICCCRIGDLAQIREAAQRHDEEFFELDAKPPHGMDCSCDKCEEFWLTQSMGGEC